ncbi:hypothetical protein AB0K12_04485 [Nonomuraea sp. NPDC049419]|uniref:hypothetical protein n=1 Tax=Nonomuraea sp. NPDC049419 TaxID=3155772 RepID=UPI00344699AA
MNAEISLSKNRRHEMWRNLLMILIAGAAVGLTVAWPTWGSLGLAVVMVIGGLAAAAVGGVLSAEATGGGRRAMRLSGAVIIVTIGLLRLALVLWPGLGAAEATWLGLATVLLNALIGVALVNGAATVDAARQDGGMTGPSPGHPLSPKRLLPAAANLSKDVAAFPLIAWSPWLALVVLAQEFLLWGFKEESTDESTGESTGESTTGTWLRAASGLALTALALLLWLR